MSAYFILLYLITLNRLVYNTNYRSLRNVVFFSLVHWKQRPWIHQNIKGFEGRGWEPLRWERDRGAGSVCSPLRSDWRPAYEPVPPLSSRGHLLATTTTTQWNSRQSAQRDIALHLNSAWVLVYRMTDWARVTCRLHLLACRETKL
jgi:hypothetical protein